MFTEKLYLPVELEYKYVLVKGDDARSGAKENPCHGWLSSAQALMGEESIISTIYLLLPCTVTAFHECALNVC